MSEVHDVPDDEVLPHYDFEGGVQGKYADRYQGTNLVCLDPDVYAFFRNSDEVNAALRALMSIIKEREAKEAEKVEAREAA